MSQHVLTASQPKWMDGEQKMAQHFDPTSTAKIKINLGFGCFFVTFVIPPTPKLSNCYLKVNLSQR